MFKAIAWGVLAIVCFGMGVLIMPRWLMELIATAGWFIMTVYFGLKAGVTWEINRRKKERENKSQ